MECGALRPLWLSRRRWFSTLNHRDPEKSLCRGSFPEVPLWGPGTTVFPLITFKTKLLSRCKLFLFPPGDQSMKGANHPVISSCFLHV